MTNRGGKREGAGRKPSPGNKTKVTIEMREPFLSEFKDFSKSEGMSYRILIETAVRVYIKSTEEGW